MRYVISIKQLGHSGEELTVSLWCLARYYFYFFHSYPVQYFRPLLSSQAFFLITYFQEFSSDLSFRGILGNIVLIVRNLTDGFDVLVY